MGHLWTLTIFLFFWRCHACGCWENSILQSRILMESQSNFIRCIAFMLVKWRCMLVSKDIKHRPLLLFQSHFKPPCGNAPLVPYRYPLPFALCSRPKASNTVLTSSCIQVLITPALARGHVQLCCLLRPLALPASAYKLPANGPSLDPDWAP